MKKVLIVLISILVCSLFFSGCNNSTSNNHEPEFNHYEIDITLDNYWKFLDVSLLGRTYTFNGVLSFAYYEDVKIELNRTITSEYTTNIYTEIETVYLNASGSMVFVANEYTFDEIKELLNVSGYMGSYSDTATIKSISGKIIYSV